MLIEHRRRGGKWRRPTTKRTGGRGYFATRTRHVRGRSLRLRRQRYAGSPTRPNRWR